MSKKLFSEQDFSHRESEWDYPKGFMFGGMSGDGNLQDYARQYMTAADLIIDAIYRNDIEDFNVSNPVLYLYRHATELYLKNILHNRNLEIENEHSLHRLINKIDDLPERIKKIVIEVHNLDNKSKAFRYQNERPKNFPDEDFCDAGNLKRQMTLLRSYFEGSKHD
jgi:HEPN domain-containing protein